MIIENANCVEACSLGDAWREVKWLCVKRGDDYVVEKGSYAGQIRRQLSFVTIRITEPGRRPLEPIMPPNIPPPTDREKIEKYFMEKLMDSKLAEKEQYVYGTWITQQIAKVLENLKVSKGNTNQACISVGDNDAVYLDDPPCLRVVSFKVVNGKLNMTVFFRSWDLVAGLPQNLGGLQLLKEYAIAYLSEWLEVSDGELIAFSDGLHIYEQYFDLANLLNVDKIAVGEKVRQEKSDFEKILDSRDKMVGKKSEPPVVYKKECSG